MKKIAIVLGVAAVATFTGCRDQDYDAKRGKRVQDEPKSIETAPVKPAPAAPVKKQEIKVVEKHCTCAPGVKHTVPCACGASDCKCVVEKVQTPTVSEPLAEAPVQPTSEFTTYVVQKGDYLSKISRKYNVTISSIKRLNNLTGDMIRIGQKLKLPGKIDVGVQSVPETRAVAKPTAKKVYAPYAGATKEYVVKSGDTLGSVAYGNGINIRQLKELNMLTSDTLKVGQKLKIPVEKVVATKPVVNVEPVAAKTVAAKTVAARPIAAKSLVAKKDVTKIESSAVPAVTAAAPKDETAVPEEAPASVQTSPVATEAASSASPAAATSTYVVLEGEDITRLAVDFGVTPTVIRELNNMGENDQIKPGQVLKIPAESQQ